MVLRRTIIAPILAFLFSLAAVGICYLLLAKHMTGQTGFAWFEAGCTAEGEQAKVNCAKVLQSPYAYWPPISAQDDPAKVGARYPVAFLGMVYYSIFAIWFLGIGTPSYSNRWVHAIPALFVMGGLAGSVYFLIIMFGKLDQWCPWCLATHGLNFGIAGCIFWMRPRRGPAAPGAITQVEITELRHPTWRLLGVTGLAVLMTIFGQRYLLKSSLYHGQAEQAKAAFQQCMEGADRLRGDAARQAKLWDATDPIPVTIRPDDPKRERGSANLPYWDLVIFSDFGCPSCKATASYLEERVQPLFAGQLRIIFKHFPLDSSCNKQLGVVRHPNACTAAKFAEAARLRGGNEAFWKVHDALFFRQSPTELLSRLDVKEVAAAMGINVQAAEADMNSPALAERIQQDCAEARSLGLKATPWLILHSKPVEGLAAKEISFWDKLADRYWLAAGTPRPASTVMQKSTPGTPNPTAGP